ncbi:alanine transaminase [Savitreella phatthalungensis]
MSIFRTSTPKALLSAFRLRMVQGAGDTASHQRLDMSRRHLSTSKTSRGKLDKSNINPCVLNAEYAVRGELAIRAEELKKELKKGKASSLGFDSVIHANIGNPQQLDQQPITFFRQVVSLCEYPELLKNEQVARQLYPQDAIDRAKELMEEIGSVGAYSATPGVGQIRQHVADYITRRDGGNLPAADPEDIYLTAGASATVHLLCQLMIASPNVGVMIPIPQYPLYTAALALYNGHAVPYYLDEEADWSTSRASMQAAYDEAVAKGIDVRALVVINPGNPTGASLREADIRDTLEFCQERELVCLADEVYQVNVFPNSPPFTSFRKVLLSDEKLKDDVQLASMHSTSKGVVGECGQRGGYVEYLNFTKEAREQIYKVASINLCPPVSGQILVDLMCKPPREGDESFAQYAQERDAIADTLHQRANQLYDAFSKMEGYSCQKPMGAMYLFPSITLPAGALEEAKSQNKSPDAFYAMQLLQSTGICVVPGSGFGQKPDTLHFRTTFLAPGDFAGRITAFHKKFMDKYR